MEKTIEKLKKEYNELCKKYEITMEKYANVNDFIDVATRYKDSCKTLKDDKIAVIMSSIGMIIVFTMLYYIEYRSFLSEAYTPFEPYLDIMLYGGYSLYVAKDYIKAIKSAIKHDKTKDDFLNACTKKDARNFLNNEVTVAYANQLIDERNKYKVELEDMLPTITAVGKILSSEDPIQGILEYGRNCPLVTEALKEEWYAYLLECEKVKPYETRITTDKIIPKSHIRVTESKPKKLLYTSSNKVNLKK